METSAEYVRGKIDDIYEKLLTSSEKNTTAENGAKVNGGVVDGGNTDDEEKVGTRGSIIEAKTIVILHLGVNYRGKHFQLEECAY